MHATGFTYNANMREARHIQLAAVPDQSEALAAFLTKHFQCPIMVEIAQDLRKLTVYLIFAEHGDGWMCKMLYCFSQSEFLKSISNQVFARYLFINAGAVFGVSNQ